MRGRSVRPSLRATSPATQSSKLATSACACRKEQGDGRSTPQYRQYPFLHTWSTCAVRHVWARAKAESSTIIVSSQSACLHGHMHMGMIIFYRIGNILWRSCGKDTQCRSLAPHPLPSTHSQVCLKITTTTTTTTTTVTARQSQASALQHLPGSAPLPWSRSK